MALTKDEKKNLDEAKKSKNKVISDNKIIEK